MTDSKEIRRRFQILLKQRPDLKDKKVVGVYNADIIDSIGFYLRTILDISEVDLDELFVTVSSDGQVGYLSGIAASIFIKNPNAKIDVNL